MKLELTQHSLTFNSTGKDPVAVLLNNSDIELLEGVFAIAEGVTSGEYKNTLRSVLNEIDTFKIWKQSRREDPIEPLPTFAFFILPNEATEIHCPQRIGDKPEQVLMLTREEVEKISVALLEASGALKDSDENYRIVEALYNDFSAFLKGLEA